jgi:isopenicillin N synthase-like dioxygenase
MQDIDRHPIAEHNAMIEQIPVIDLADVLCDVSSNAALTAVDQIADACKHWGFFQIVNHGIERSQIEDVWRQTRSFFALPTAEKLEIERSKDNPWGFYNRELTKNQRDKKEVFDFTREDFDPIYQQHNRWLQRHPDFKATMLAYQEACTRLSLQLLSAFCVGLDLPVDYLHPHFEGNHTGFVRLNYYPLKDPLAGEQKGQAQRADLGIHHHTDSGALTVLLQDEVSGLQVYQDGLWYDVPTIEDAITINTGDMMQVWSNDSYRAAIHRVRAMEERERYSIPFFLNPAADCRVSPLPSTINADNPCRYQPIVWGDYRGRRSDGDFADYGTEVQISQYRN